MSLDRNMLLQKEQEWCAYFEGTASEEVNKRIASGSEPEEYFYFSPVRENVLNWYPFKALATVLEIGCGYGAITGALAGTDRNVKALEVNASKAYVASVRYARNENIEIVNGTASGVLASEELFDYIVLNGTLGYQCGGTDEKKMYGNFISELAKHLKENGRILVISENPLGAAYLCGKPAPSSNCPFDSLDSVALNAKYGIFTPGEFAGIVDIEKLHCRLYYYMADSAFPQEVYTDCYLPGKNALERAVLCRTYPYTVVADEKKLLQRSVESGTFGALCNGYLAEIGKDAFDYDVIYATCASDRGEDGYITALRSDGKATKQSLAADRKRKHSEFVGRMKALEKRKIPVIDMKESDDKLVMSRITLPTLSEVLMAPECLCKENIISIFDKLWQYILLSSDISDTVAETFASSVKADWHVLKHAYADMVPFNCFYSKEGLLFFDQEFVFDDYPAEYVMFRALNYTYYFSKGLEAIAPQRELAERYKVWDSWDIFAEAENAFIAQNRKKDRAVWYYAASELNYEKEIPFNRNRLVRRKESFGTKKYKVGYVAGVFDLFHTGHINLLRRASDMCDYLIVGVLTDELVQHFKAKTPIISQENRMEVVANCRWVDEVVSVDFDNIDKITAFGLYHFDCLFSGDDWKESEAWESDRRKLRELGSDIVYFEYTKGISSTSIRQKMGEKK